MCGSVGEGATGAHPGQNVGTPTTAWPLGALLHFWAPCKLQHPQVPGGARGWGVDRSVAARELRTPPEQWDLGLRLQTTETKKRGISHVSDRSAERCMRSAAGTWGRPPFPFCKWGITQGCWGLRLTPEHCSGSCRPVYWFHAGLLPPAWGQSEDAGFAVLNRSIARSPAVSPSPPRWRLFQVNPGGGTNEVQPMSLGRCPHTRGAKGMKCP